MRGIISFIIHATEDEEKVVKAIANALKIDDLMASLSTQRLTGHFRNPILYVKWLLPGKRTYEAVESVLRALDATDKVYLERHLEEFADKKGNIYLRLKKQDLCLGRIALSNAGGIKIYAKIKDKEILKMLEMKVKKVLDTES
ncbi:MAG: hypothetical protein GTO54_09655 [Nitrososphaeria archaeon]|nr:hypothetical protein [Nitrososphaeria archaeon]